MSELQASVTESNESTDASPVALCEGFCSASGEVILERTDWAAPVGFFTELRTKRIRSSVRGFYFDWVRVDLPRLRLAHKAALLLLQGQTLSAILIPNHRVVATWLGSGETHHTLGHVLLRCDPWQYYLAVPALTGVTIAKLGEIPDGISSAEVLAVLAQDSLA